MYFRLAFSYNACFLSSNDICLSRVDFPNVLAEVAAGAYKQIRNGFIKHVKCWNGLIGKPFNRINAILSKQACVENETSPRYTLGQKQTRPICFCSEINKRGSYVGCSKRTLTMFFGKEADGVASVPGSSGVYGTLPSSIFVIVRSTSFVKPKCKN